MLRAMVSDARGQRSYSPYRGIGPPLWRALPIAAASRASGSLTGRNKVKAIHVTATNISPGRSSRLLPWHYAVVPRRDAFMNARRPSVCQSCANGKIVRKYASTGCCAGLLWPASQSRASRAFHEEGWIAAHPPAAHATALIPPFVERSSDGCCA